MIERITEREITLALKERHQKRGDYFASQVKMGAAGSKILDAIAIPPTWSPRTIIGYEIKVSRSDFLSDQKFPHYMTTSNLFYFVVPKGLITKEEVPQRVGILEYNNGKLRQLKRAVYENVEINTDMLLHCIFYKLQEKIRPVTKAEHIANIKAKLEGKQLGMIIGKKYREMENKQMFKKDDDWIKFRETLKERFGIDILYPFQVYPYIDANNKKYNNAVRLLEEASNLFKEEKDEQI